jgi:hypothetical protein
MPSTVGIVASGVETGFSPLSLSPVVWLDASDTSTITASSGAVSEWRDKSGNSYHLTQSTSTRQPQTSISTINSLNVITFDGSSDTMANTAVPSTSRPHTYLIVAKETTGITTTKALVNATPFVGLNEVLALYLTGTSPNRRSNSFTNSTAYAGQTFTTTSANVIYFVANGASSAFGINGTYATRNILGTTRGAGFRVPADTNGSSEFFNGDIAEVLYWNSALSDTNRDLVTNYLKTKWGI